MLEVHGGVRVLPPVGGLIDADKTHEMRVLHKEARPQATPWAFSKPGQGLTLGLGIHDRSCLGLLGLVQVLIFVLEFVRRLFLLGAAHGGLRHLHLVVLILVHGRRSGENRVADGSNVWWRGEDVDHPGVHAAGCRGVRWHRSRPNQKRGPPGGLWLTPFRRGLHLRRSCWRVVRGSGSWGRGGGVRHGSRLGLGDGLRLGIAFCGWSGLNVIDADCGFAQLRFA